MAPPSYAGPGERAWHYILRGLCALTLFFLVAPILVIVPLSFNAEKYFTFTQGMLSLDPAAFSLKWYAEFLDSPAWRRAIVNSLVIAAAATAIATFLGTLAALGLARRQMPGRPAVLAALVSPMIVPLVISATGMFFFYSAAGLAKTHPGVILAHAALGTPFVVITVAATLSGFDPTLTRAALSLGATPARSFFSVTLPLIWPGVVSGALFAFITSFDEIVVVLFLAGLDQRTIPRQMWSGIREEISPTILAVATLLVAVSVLFLAVVELLRRRGARLRGVG